MLYTDHNKKIKDKSNIACGTLDNALCKHLKASKLKVALEKANETVEADSVLSITQSGTTDIVIGNDEDSSIDEEGFESAIDVEGSDC